MFSLITGNYSLLLTGIGNTLLLLGLSAICGIVLACLLTAGNFLLPKPLNKLIDGYLFTIRGTPFLLQLFIIYYGSMQFHWISSSFIGTLLKNAMPCAVIALTLNTAAYTSVLFIGAVKNLNQKQILAGKCLGLSTYQIYKTIVIPQMIQRVLPVYGNELIMLLKCTAISSSITVVDVMGATQQMIGMTYQSIPCLIIAAIIYSVFSVIIVIPTQITYKKYNKKLNIA